MATEVLFADFDDSGWPTGTFADLDDDDDGTFMAATVAAESAETVLFTFPDVSIVTTADLVTAVTLDVRGRTDGTGTDTIDMQMWIDSNPLGITNGGNLGGSFAVANYQNNAYDSDWSESSLNTIIVGLVANQSGKGADVGHQMAKMWINIEYTPAGVGINPSLLRVPPYNVQR